MILKGHACSNGPQCQDSTEKHNTYHHSGPHPGELEKESPVPSWLSKAGAGAERSPHTVCPHQPAMAETFKWLQLQPG